MKILAIETSCDETAAAVVKTSRLPLIAYRYKVQTINNYQIADSGQRIAECRILSNAIASQINIHKKFGGVFPEHASRAHAEKIIDLVEAALEDAELSPSAVPVDERSVLPRLGNEVKQEVRSRMARAAESEEIIRGRLQNIDLIAVTTGPGLIGSLLIGVNFAKTLAYATGKPIIGINHWLGHIYSNFVRVECKNLPRRVKAGQKPKIKMTNQNVKLPEFPAIILIASGGHTGLVLMKNHNDIQTLGETLDDAAGEAFDKVAKLLGLGYPGGPSIAKAAEKCHSERSEESPANAGSRTSREILHYVQDDNIKFPRSMLDRKDYNFSFSGLKTAVLYKVRELTKSYKLEAISPMIAAEFQQAVIDVLIAKTIQAAYQFNPKSICLCGGVSANYELREQLKKATVKLPWKTSFFVPPMELTTDNAAMIGIAASYHLDKATTWDKINANANLRID